MTKLFLMPLSTVLLFLVLISNLYAGAIDFQTPEYWASTGLDSIGAANAYALGFTGKGVVVGVLDSWFAPEQGEFAGKYPYGVFLNKYDDDSEPHGIQVSGIIAAAKNNIGMHGVAFDATLMPFGFKYTQSGIEGSAGDVDSWNVILNQPDVTTVNNSWGFNLHLDSDYTDYHGMVTDPRFWTTLLNGEVHNEILTTAEAMGQADKLLVIAAGNEGHLSPSSTAGLPTAAERANADDSSIDSNLFKNNWISVSSFDPRYVPTDPYFISLFSNLGLDASEYTLLAPGSVIYSTISSDRYITESGTSMAAPYVSGVAALVQQAFPYMGGKQLADVLFSTATPMNTPGSYPELFILQRTDYVVYTEEKDGNIDYIAGSEQEERITNDDLVYTYSGSSVDKALTDEQRVHFEVLGLDDYTSLFGQGIVNAFKAVQGPGYFNANRLDKDDLSKGNEFDADKYYAMYPVDTKGFDSTWSNDIGQKKNTDVNSDLYDLPVGLRKQGQGLLYMTGANSYEGPTVVESGAISLGKEGYEGVASLHGNVYVRSEGLFTGNGIVGYDPVNNNPVTANLYSEGLLMPGLESSPGSRLTVQGDVSSNGVLRLVLGQNGQGNGLDAENIVVSGVLQITGGQGTPIRPYTDYVDLLTAAISLDVSGLEQSITVSPFLSFLAYNDGQSFSLFSQTKALNSLPDVPGRTKAVVESLHQIFQQLDGNPLQRDLDFLFNQSRQAFLDTAAAMRGDVHSATLEHLPLKGRLMPLVNRGTFIPLAEEDEVNLDLPYAGDKGPEIWIRPMIGYTSTDGKSSIGQNSQHSRMKGLALGLEHDLENVYAGVLLAVGHSELEQHTAYIWDTRLGLYGGWSEEGLSLNVLANAGWQNYKISREISSLSKSSRLKSNFDGFSTGLGLEAAYNLLYGASDTLALSPYVAFDLDYIWQQNRKESGHEVFALHVRDKEYCQTSLHPGLRFEMAPVHWLTLATSGGYRRVLSGDEPELRASFKANPDYRFNLVAPDKGKDFVTYSLKAEALLSRNLRLSANFFGESSSRSNAVTGLLNMRYEW